MYQACLSEPMIWKKGHQCFVLQGCPISPFAQPATELSLQFQESTHPWKVSCPIDLVYLPKEKRGNWNGGFSHLISDFRHLPHFPRGFLESAGSEELRFNFVSVKKPRNHLLDEINKSEVPAALRFKGTRGQDSQLYFQEVFLFYVHWKIEHYFFFLAAKIGSMFPYINDKLFLSFFLPELSSLAT